MTEDNQEGKHAAAQKETGTFLGDGTYDKLKFLAQIVLPALGALYFGLADIWGLPKAQEVVGTVTVIDLFLGALLGLSTAKYNSSDAKYDGAIEIEETDSAKKFSLSLHSDPDELDQKKEVLFKVTPSTE